jgi:manganese transport protein
VKQVFQVALGILAAIGGFVDIGDLVFTTQAGAAFGYELLWALVVGVIGIIVYAEMCGRVATVTGRPVMTVVRQRLGYSAGLVTMAASLLLNLLTLAAEVGGVALVLQLMFDFNYSTLILISVISLTVIVWVLPFEWIERVFGYVGLCLLVYAVAAIDLHPNWSSVGNGFAPSLPGESLSLYAYFAVGIIAAALMPYEVYFYSSGAVEEHWKPKQLSLNRLNSVIGFGLGGFLALALIMTAAQVFYPLSVQPEFIGTTMLGANVPLGETGLIFAAIGILFAVGGAAIDTCLAGAYTLAQFLGWEWGKYRRPAIASRFTITWVTLFALAYVIVSTGVDPVMLTEYAVVFSVVALPFTYLPVLLIARDRTFMGEHANGPISSFFGWFYLVVIAIVGAAAIPLLFATNAGGG